MKHYFVNIEFSGTNMFKEIFVSWLKIKKKFSYLNK